MVKRIRFESYEDGRDRLFVNGEYVTLKGHTLDIEDLIPIFRTLGIAIEAVSYEGNRPDHDQPNDAEGFDIAAASL